MSHYSYRMFGFRQNCKYVTRVTHIRRTMSISRASALMDIKFDNDGIATVTMHRPPVNALNLDMLLAFRKTLDEVEKRKCKGMILTSSLPTVFCAGLDVMELYKPDVKRLETLWSTLQDVWFKMFGSSFITAAAVNGFAVASGCMLAMSCEYRVMVSGKHTIGLNEASHGLVVSQWFVDTVTNIISRRQAELALTTGALFTVHEALKVGLIDEIAMDKDDAIKKCRQFIKRFDEIPSHLRELTKRRVRAAPLTWLQEHREEDLQEFIGYVIDPIVQESFAEYVQIMKRKKM